MAMLMIFVTFFSLGIGDLRIIPAFPILLSKDLLQGDTNRPYSLTKAPAACAAGFGADDGGTGRQKDKDDTNA